MAGVTIEELVLRCGSQRVVRTMPNAAVAIAQSYTPWFATQTLSTADQGCVRAILRAIGAEDRVCKEEHIDTLTAISGGGHAYPALMAKALIDVATTKGLPYDIAVRASKAVVCDASMLLRNESDDPSCIVQRFIDYDGTTAAALRAAVNEGFSRAICAAVAAGSTAASERHHRLASFPSDF